VVAFRGPAYSEHHKRQTALDLLGPMAFGENSELYQRLVLKEQKVDQLSVSFEDRKDPELFAIFARVKDLKDVDYVRDQILSTFKRCSTEPIPTAEAGRNQSRLRYGFALSLNSSEAIAGALASYVGLRRTAETIDKVTRSMTRSLPGIFATLPRVISWTRTERLSLSPRKRAERGRVTMLHRLIAVLLLFSFVFATPALTQRRRPMGQLRSRTFCCQTNRRW